MQPDLTTEAVNANCAPTLSRYQGRQALWAITFASSWQRSAQPYTVSVVQHRTPGYPSVRPLPVDVTRARLCSRRLSKPVRPAC